MTTKESLYWGLWSEYKKFLVEQKGWEPKRANEFRHTLVQRIFGHQISSKKFTQSDLDKWKAVIKAHTEPDNIQLQIDQENQPIKRALFGLWKTARELGLPDDYVHRLVLKMTKQELCNCDADQISKVAIALRMQKRRHQSQAKKESEITTDPF